MSKMFLSSLIEEIILQLKFLASKAILNYVGCQLAKIVVVNLKNINVISWNQVNNNIFDTIWQKITEINEINFCKMS